MKSKKQLAIKQINERGKMANKEFDILSKHINSEINRICKKYRSGYEITFLDAILPNQEPQILFLPPLAKRSLKIKGVLRVN